MPDETAHSDFLQAEYTDLKLTDQTLRPCGFASELRKLRVKSYFLCMADVPRLPCFSN